MCKLLTWVEAKKIADRMCAEYGLPPPKMQEYSRSSYDDRVMPKITVKSFLKPGWFGGNRTQKESSFYENSLEALLESLEKYLSDNFGARSQRAETLRGKYAMAEANELLDEELRQ